MICIYEVINKLRKKPLYNSDDLNNHRAIAAVIKDDNGKILVQDHVKYNFWTIPVGKVKDDQTTIDALKEEVFEECNIKIIDCKVIIKQQFEYIRNGIPVIVESYLYDVLKYSGTVKNMEPTKHRSIKFMSIEEISKLPYLSDMTKLYLKTLGINYN